VSGPFAVAGPVPGPTLWAALLAERQAREHHPAVRSYNERHAAVIVLMWLLL
jgi:hypothetical protein